MYANRRCSTQGACGLCLQVRSVPEDTDTAQALRLVSDDLRGQNVVILTADLVCNVPLQVCTRCPRCCLGPHGHEIALEVSGFLWVSNATLALVTDQVQRVPAEHNHDCQYLRMRLEARSCLLTASFLLARMRVWH